MDDLEILKQERERLISIINQKWQTKKRKIHAPQNSNSEENTGTSNLNVSAGNDSHNSTSYPGVCCVRCVVVCALFACE